MKADWKEMVRLKDGGFDDKYQDMVKALLEDGTLSFSSNGNYQVIGGGVCITPRSHGLIRTYFTKERGAEAYAKVECKNAMYDVTINKVVKELNLRR